MAVIKPVYHNFPEVQVITWLMGEADEGDPVLICTFNDKSYGMWGNWSSATCVLQGSFDPSSPPRADSWVTLKESDNTTSISNTAIASGVVLENPIWIRPVTSGGSGSGVRVCLVAK